MRDRVDIVSQAKHKKIHVATRLALLLGALIGLYGCSAGGGSTQLVQVPCDLPTFTPQVGQQLLNTWGDNLVKYVTDPSFGGLYIAAGYFTMSNYTEDAVLLPTVSYVQRQGTQELYDYFVHFLANRPVMSLPNNGESTVFAQLGCGYGSADGYYDFQITNPETESVSIVNARFSFVYKYESQQIFESFMVESGPAVGQIFRQLNKPAWYIWSQQSSVLPPKP